MWESPCGVRAGSVESVESVESVGSVGSVGPVDSVESVCPVGQDWPYPHLFLFLLD